MINNYASGPWKSKQIQLIQISGTRLGVAQTLPFGISKINYLFRNSAKQQAWHFYPLSVTEHLAASTRNVKMTATEH